MTETQFNQLVDRLDQILEAQAQHKPLRVKRPEAARMLSVSERVLQDLPVPCVREGRSVLYEVAALRRYATGGAA